MNESNYFLRGGGGTIFPKSLYEYIATSLNSEWLAHRCQKEGRFGKILWGFCQFPYQFPLRKHPISPSSSVTGPNSGKMLLASSICLRMKEFFGIVFMKSCIFCQVWTSHCNWFALYCQMYNIRQSGKDQQTRMEKRWAEGDASVKWGGMSEWGLII